MTTWKAPVTQGYTHWTESVFIAPLQQKFPQSGLLYWRSFKTNIFIFCEMSEWHWVVGGHLKKCIFFVLYYSQETVSIQAEFLEKSLFSPFWDRIKQASGDTHQVLLYFSKKKYFSVDFKLHQRHWRALRHCEIQEIGRHYCDLISSLCWKLSFPDGSQTSVLWTY